MKRYLLNENLNNLPKVKTDVLIVGSGIAGLYAAFNLDASMKVMVVTKASIEKSNSWLAQGGIASVIAPDDVFESHIEDTLKAGAGLCDLAAVTTLVEEGPSDIRALRELSVPFDKGEDGADTAAEESCIAAAMLRAGKQQDAWARSLLQEKI